jgi:hypothetical protein
LICNPNSNRSFTSIVFEPFEAEITSNQQACRAAVVLREEKGGAQDRATGQVRQQQPLGFSGRSAAAGAVNTILKH